MTGPLMDAPGRLAEHAGHLGILLAEWSYRDTATDPAAAVRASTVALEVMDAMLAELFTVRAALVAARRRGEDEHAAKVDAMLAARTGRNHP